MLFSPNKQVQIECAIETIWVGNRVYPDVLVWRAWYKNRPVITNSFFRLREYNGATLAYGLRDCKIERRAGNASFAVYRVSATDGKGATLSALFVVSNDRMTYAILSTGKAGPEATEEQDFSLTTFPHNCVHINPEADFYLPHAFFTPQGKIVAYERHPFRFQAWFFDRPGDLATARLGTLQAPDEWLPKSGEQALIDLFALVPFWQNPPASIQMDDSLTPAFREALTWMIFGSKGTDQEWMMRGEPGDFAILARREGDQWQIAGISATEKTLTIRLEDLWGRTPEDHLPNGSRTIRLIRDPNQKETDQDKIIESFPDSSPFTKISLEVKANGGFLISI